MNKHLIEEYQNIMENQPVFPGDTISHSNAYELERRGLIKRNEQGDWITATKPTDFLANLSKREGGGT